MTCAGCGLRALADILTEPTCTGLRAAACLQDKEGPLAAEEAQDEEPVPHGTWDVGSVLEYLLQALSMLDEDITGLLHQVLLCSAPPQAAMRASRLASSAD